MNGGSLRLITNSVENEVEVEDSAKMLYAKRPVIMGISKTVDLECKE